MELFIQIRNGQPFEHPIFGDNFCDAFPHIDVNNLPPEFAKFKRVQEPAPKTYEVVVGVRYEWIGDTVQDVWECRQMTNDEVFLKQNELQEKINFTLQDRKNKVTEIIANETNETIKAAWVEYLAQLNVWVVTDLENPRFPPPPAITKDGYIFTTESSGAVPNVIN
jgi:hypothetical protein